MNTKITAAIIPGQPMQVDVQGAQGDSCTELTKPLEQMGVVEVQEFKPGYFQSNISLDATTTINQEGF